LRVEVNALTARILFDGQRAVGVEFLKEGKSHKASAAAEVILSGGTFNSPQLLERSGVGRKAFLEEKGIPVVHDLPGVGEDLHEHSGFTISVSQTQVESRGSSHVRSANPAEPPAIRYNYLATENDRRVMVEGLKIARRIAHTSPMREYVTDEYFPGAAVQSDD